MSYQDETDEAIRAAGIIALISVFVFTLSSIALMIFLFRWLLS